MADTASLIARVKTEGVDAGAKQLDNFSASATKADSAVNQLTPDVGKANTATGKAASDGFAKFRNGAQQVGFQVQDMVVQLQSGTSAFVAIGQQGSQLAGAFGPGGAVLGAVIALASAVGGVLYKSLTETEGSTKDLDAAQKQLKDTFQQTTSGTLELTDSMIQLSAVSKEAAETQLALAQANAELISQQTAKAVKEDADAWGTWKASTSAAISQYDSLIDKGRDVGDTLDALAGTYEGNIVGVNILAQNITELSDKFGVNRDQAIDMIAAQSEFNKQPTAENARKIADVFTQWLGETTKLNPELIRLTTSANNNATALEGAEKAASAAAEAQKKLGSNVNTTTVAYQNQTAQIIKNQQIAVLSDRDRARAQGEEDKKMFAQRKDLTDADIKAYNAARDKQTQEDIEAINAREQKKTNVVARQSDNRAAAQAKREESEAQRQQKAAETFIAGIERRGADEIATINATEQQKLAKLDEFQQQGAISAQQYEETKTKIQLDADTARQEELDKRKKDRQDKEQKGDDFLAQIMGQNAVELELYDIQQKQKEEVAKKYREQGLISEQEYQSSLVNISENYNKKRRDSYASMLGQTTDDLRNALGEGNKMYKAFAIANAIMNTYQAANAAYQSAAAIPIAGWILGPIAAGAAVVAGLANVAKIRSAREQGGNLSAGQMSTIAERGRPEVIMPASASRVRTAQQMRQIMGDDSANRSGGDSVVIVNNTTGRIDSAQTERDDEGRLRVIIDEYVTGQLADSNSNISKTRRATRAQPGF